MDPNGETCFYQFFLIYFTLFQWNIAILPTNWNEYKYIRQSTKTTPFTYEYLNVMRVRFICIFYDPVVQLVPSTLDKRGFSVNVSDFPSLKVCNILLYRKIVTKQCSLLKNPSTV